MTLQTPLTELEAVNVMLGALGEAPINSLGDGVSSDVTTALSLLRDTSKAVQTSGWLFNTERDYPLVPDIDGKINLAANIAQVDQDEDHDSGDYDLVQRGTVLYDRKHHTDVFTDTVRAEVVLLLPFDETPPIFRRYVTIKAARIFQQRIVGSETLAGFELRDEAEAKIAFEDAEGETNDYTIFDNYTVARSLDRNR
jgi:hypothetical protein